MPREQRDRWDKIDIILKPVGGLVTALTVAVVGFFGSRHLENLQQAERRHVDQRQTREMNARLYAELMSSREEADTALRQQMLNSIINTFLGPKHPEQPPEEKVLALELLAYNFHDALDLGPLFKHVAGEIQAALGPGSAAPQTERFARLQERLERVAREVTAKQLATLRDGGILENELMFFFDDVDSAKVIEVLPDRTLTLTRADQPGPARRFTLWVYDFSKERREARVRLEVWPVGADSAEIDVDFWVGFFDFPMIDNTRLAGGDRTAVVLRQWNEGSGMLALAYFPGSRASLKQKPYYEEVIQTLLRAQGRLALDEVKLGGGS